MKIKTTVSYHLLPRIAITFFFFFKVSVDENVENRKPLHTIGRMQIGATTMRKSMEVFKKLNTVRHMTQESHFGRIAKRIVIMMSKTYVNSFTATLEEYPKWSKTQKYKYYIFSLIWGV